MIQIVDTLPDVAFADVHTIYVVNTTNSDEEFRYEEFILVNGIFKKISDNAKTKYISNDNKQPQVHYCTSCGATLKRNSHKCEYCDTEYW